MFFQTRNVVSKKPIFPIGIMPMETSHIWIGNFGPQAPADFFEEQYVDEDKPISQFAESQNEHWIDHDWMELSYEDKPLSISALVDGHSYSEDYLGLVQEKCTELAIESANVFVLCDINEIENPSSILEEAYQLHYLGTFRCNVDV